MKLVKYSAALLGLFAALAFGQTSGTISGIIKDESGASIANARVVAISAETSERREAVSSASGQYTFPFLAPGR